MKQRPEELWNRSTKPGVGSLKELIRQINHQPALLKRREKTQINKIINERGKITTNSKEIQTILKTYYEQLYANKLGNLEKYGCISGKPQITKTGTGRNRKPEQADYQGGNRSSHQKTSQDTKVQGQMASQGNSIKRLKKKQYLFY